MCFVLERKHRVVKRFQLNQQNPKSYETHLISQITAQHIDDWTRWHKAEGLIKPRECPAQVESALRQIHDPTVPPRRTAMGAVSARGAQVWRGDFVLLGAEHAYAAGEVYFHFECDDGRGPQTVMRLHALARVGAERLAAAYKLSDAMPQVVPTRLIHCSAISRCSERTLTALWPLEYRSVVR